MRENTMLSRRCPEYPIANGCLMAYFINKFNCYQVMKQGEIRIRVPPMGMLEPFSL